jgi:hypothetical protein
MYHYIQVLDGAGGGIEGIRIGSGRGHLGGVLVVGWDAGGAVWRSGWSGWSLGGEIPLYKISTVPR